MPATIQSHLAANLTLLAKHNADLAEVLREPSPTGGDESIEFFDSGQGVPAASLGGRQLCSRHRPLEEASRLADGVDLVEHAVVVVLGFGLGYHVRRLAERLGSAGIIIVFEPNLALLRAAFDRIDHSAWLGKATVLFLTDADDRGALGAKLNNCEAILAQGVTFLEHPASKGRLGEVASKFSTLITDHMSAAQVTMNTTLTRTVDTIRNLLLNFDHYGGGSGVADLKDAAKGYPAILVAAGPSLHRNVHLLSQPGVRERCVIIAVQTVLKPLLAAGIRPHFVTALDFHELSSRFYEGLSPEDVREVTLIAEPKVHPSVLDLFPGRSRCIASAFLDKLMGDQARDMGRLPAGSTVAHLSLYVARHLGCDPIAMIGQDLGFPDGLYYASGNAVHELWAPELNPFNTLEMMEWQRIRRFHDYLHKTKDVHGKSIYTDAQMVAYLQQFERDFHECKRDGVAIIDATEGGVAKQHTTVRPLAEVLDQNAKRTIPPLPAAQLKSEADVKRLEETRKRVASVRRDVAALRETSKKTAAILRQMLGDQRDGGKMERHFHKIERMKKRVEDRILAFELISHLNQVGMYKRLRADRRLTMSRDVSPLARQRVEIERDLENVTWIADAAEEMIDRLLDAERVLGGESPGQTEVGKAMKPWQKTVGTNGGAAASNVKTRAIALVPIDPDRNGLGIARSLADDFFGRSVLQATLERLGSCRRLDEIVLIAPHGFDVDALLDRGRISTNVTIDRCEGSPFGPEHEAIAAARLWSDTCWRGGISGTSVYDEVLAPQIMDETMKRRGITAALLAAPDWPLIDPSPESGCDAVIARYMERPETRSIVFTQAPPGLCGCLVSASLMADLANRNRLATIGARLVYQPHLPQVDPITKPANVQIDHRVRNSLIRATFDSPRYKSVIREALRGCEYIDRLSSVEIVSLIESALRRRSEITPRHIILELTPQRSAGGVFARHSCGDLDRTAIDPSLAKGVFEQCAEAGDCVVTIAGAGDPLLHPQFDSIIASAKACGIRGVHVRTPLLAPREQLDRLLASGVDVISVDLHADRAATYKSMMGSDGFKEVFANIEYIIEHRRRLTSNAPAAAFGVPWVVPRLQRRSETYEDVESFFDRWQHVLGTSVIEGVPAFPSSDECPPDTLVQPWPPKRVVARELENRMMILSDGFVPISELDLAGHDCAGNVNDREITSIWTDLIERRRALCNGKGEPGVLRP